MIRLVFDTYWCRRSPGDMSAGARENLSPRDQLPRAHLHSNNRMPTTYLQLLNSSYFE